MRSEWQLSHRIANPTDDDDTGSSGELNRKTATCLAVRRPRAMNDGRRTSDIEPEREDELRSEHPEA